MISILIRDTGLNMMYSNYDIKVRVRQNITPQWENESQHKNRNFYNRVTFLYRVSNPVNCLMYRKS